MLFKKCIRLRLVMKESPECCDVRSIINFRDLARLTPEISILQGLMTIFANGIRHPGFQNSIIHPFPVSSDRSEILVTIIGSRFKGHFLQTGSRYLEFRKYPYCIGSWLFPQIGSRHCKYRNSVKHPLPVYSDRSCSEHTHCMVL